MTLREFIERLERSVITADADNNTVTVNNITMQLTPMEFRILQALHRLMPLKKNTNDIVWEVWGGEDEPDWASKAVNVHMFRIRRKMLETGIPLRIASQVGPDGWIRLEVT